MSEPRTSPEKRAELERILTQEFPIERYLDGYTEEEIDTLLGAVPELLADLADVTAERDAARAEVAAVREPMEKLAAHWESQLDAVATSAALDLRAALTGQCSCAMHGGNGGSE